MPYSWDFMKQFNFSNPPTVPFCRNHTVEENYMIALVLKSKKGGNLFGKKYLCGDKDFNMTLNNFPYDRNQVLSTMLSGSIQKNLENLTIRRGEEDYQKIRRR